jgi:hypothetical protein
LIPQAEADILSSHKARFGNHSQEALNGFDPMNPRDWNEEY